MESRAQSSSPTVRHEGLVQVRGKIRRVWRPRFLQVCDDAMVRYYEVVKQPPSLWSSPAKNFSDLDHDTHKNHALTRQAPPRPRRPSSPLFRDTTLHHNDHDDKNGRVPNTRPQRPTPKGTRERQRPQSKSHPGTQYVLEAATTADHSWDYVPDISSSTDSPETAKQTTEDLFIETTTVVHTSPKQSSATANSLSKQDRRGSPVMVDRSSNSSSHNSPDGGRGGSQQRKEEENVVPKCVMQILEARIIDPTTLRDMHVGLPWGSFGFVFLARPSCLGTTMESIPTRDYLCAVSTLEEAQSWVVALQWAASVQPRDRRESWEFGERHGGPLFQHRSLALEALANSASFQGSHSFPSRHSMAPNKNTNDNDNNDDNHSIGEDSFSSVHSTMAPQSASNHKSATQRAESSQKSRTNRATTTLETSGQIIMVPRVWDFCITWRPLLGKTKRDGYDYSSKILAWRDDCRLYYQVRMLLLRGGSSKQFVEERTVYRSHDDFVDLVEDLLDEYNHHRPPNDDETGGTQRRDNTTKTTCSTPKGSNTALIQMLKKVEMDLMTLNIMDRMERPRTMSRLRWFQLRVSHILTSPFRMYHNIGKIDGILRQLAMNGDICNSNSIRLFLNLKGIQTYTHLVRTNHAPSRVCANHTRATGKGIEYLVVQRSLSIMNGGEKVGRDKFVKDWLQEKNSPVELWLERGKLCITLAFQSRSITTTLAVMALLCSNSVVWFCVHNAGTIVPIRFDVYLLTLMIAFYVGRENGRIEESMSNDDSNETKAHPHRTKHTRRVRPTDRPAPTISPVGATSQEDIVDPALVEDIVIDDDEEEEMSVTTEEDASFDEEGDERDNDSSEKEIFALSSPLPFYPDNGGESCWSIPDHQIFKVRGSTYLQDKVKISSAPAVFTCRGVDVWLTDNPESHIARHPSLLGGMLTKEKQDTLVVNFLLPFCNFVSYFSIPPLEEMPKNVANVWSKFISGDQQYRDARLKLLPVVVDGPWIVRKAVGPGTSPALMGKVIPLQYYFTAPTAERKGIYEVDVIITASRIAKGILNVVKGHTNTLTIAFAFIIEAASESDLPETVLCAFQMHELQLDKCPQLPEHNLEGVTDLD